MANKKTKLTLTGIAKKSIQNIELAKTQSKNTVVIEKKPNNFFNSLLYSIFVFESKIINFINFPFGISIIGCFQRND